jgi:hypothetical protein
LGGNSAGLRTAPANFGLLLADGERRIVKESLDVSLTIGVVTARITLRVMPGPCSERSPYILFGRELIGTFGIEIRGLVPFQGNRPLYDSVKLIDDYVEQFVELRSEEPLDELPIVVREPRVVVSVDEETKEIDIPAVLRELASTETELPLCPGAIMKLRESRQGEPEDTPEQKYTFELGLPPIKEQSTIPQGGSIQRACIAGFRKKTRRPSTSQ